MIQCSCGFFEFLSMEFAACSKPPSRDNHQKASDPRTPHRDQMRVEPRSFDQGRRKKDAFTHLVTLPTVSTIPILHTHNCY